MQSNKDDEMQPADINSSDEIESINSISSNEFEPVDNDNKEEEITQLSSMETIQSETSTLIATEYVLLSLSLMSLQIIIRAYSYFSSSSSSFLLQQIRTPSVGQTFKTWDDVDKYFKDYAWQENFVVIRIRNERDSSQVCRRRTFACDRQGTYNPKKTVILENQRNSRSKRSGCPWHVNLTFPKKVAVINVTSLDLNHNHPLISETNTYAAKNRALPEAVLREIRFYTVDGNLNSTIQRRLLSSKFSDVTIYPRDLQNQIQKYKTSEREESDAARLLKHLLDKKAEEPGWEVFWELHHETNSLDKLFWMSPDQVQRWITYHDVILNDNTHRTNLHNMPLSIFVAVDNHFRTRLVAQALVNDETKETYEWLLAATLKATNYAPRVFITDADPGMDAAVDTQYSDTYPLHCIYHISQNILRNLKAPLGDTFNEFLKDFYQCQRVLSPTDFDTQMNNLIATYPKAANYLNSELYPSKERWAKAYTTKFFTAGISSTSRVEGENSIIKNSLQGCPSLCELATVLDQRLCDEAQYVNHTEWHYSTTSAQLTGASTECFPKIDHVLKEYLTEEMLSRQRHEVIQSLYYYAKESDCLVNDQPTEEGYDAQQIHLDSLLEDISSGDIIRIYQVQRRYCTHKNFVVLIADHSHFCTCMLLINKGLICRHFLHVLAIDNEAFFHITLIPTRWYKSEKMQDPELYEKPYLTGNGSVQSHGDFLSCPKHFPMHEITKIRGNDVFSPQVRHAVQKRHDYGQTFNLARKAVRCAVEAGGESLSRLKRSLNDWFIEEQRTAAGGDDKENFDPGQVGNPIEKRRKGRPPVKRLKSAVETSQTKNKKPTSGGNKCGKCGDVGHYAPTCKK